MKKILSMFVTVEDLEEEVDRIIEINIELKENVAFI